MKANKKILALLIASAIASGNTTTLFAASKSEETKEQLKSIQQDKANLSKKTQELEALINSTDTKINKTQQELEKILASKIENEKLLNQTREELNKDISELKQQTATYYMNSYSANNSALEMLLKSESVSDYIVTSTHLEHIVKKKDDLVTEVKCASSSKPMETLAAANETSIGRS